MIVDSVLKTSIGKADSITFEFQQSVDIVGAEFQREFSSFQAQERNIQAKLDSLQNLNLPSNQLAQKLDSLRKLKNEKVDQFNKKLDEIKSKANIKLQALQLPAEFQEPLQKLQSSIQSYSLPELPLSSINMPKDLSLFEKVKIPSFTEQLKSYPALKNLLPRLDQVGDLTKQVGTYVQDAQQVVKGNIDEVKNIDKTMETKLTEASGVSQFSNETALIKNGKLDSAAMADMAKQALQQEIANVAQDHFAGKGEVLKEALQNVSKLKMKYSEATSLADLPKRPPNPLKGKPFIERLMPAIGFQVQKVNYTMVDVTPMVSYRIRPRLSAGLGWNERLAIYDSKLMPEERIYGPRGVVAFQLNKGFSVRLLPEIMNAKVPPYYALSRGTDLAHREWIPGLFAGLKKDFKLSKSISGFSEITYNLYDSKDRSPYAKEFSARFGFEFAMKKKIRKATGQ